MSIDPHTMGTTENPMALHCDKCNGDWVELFMVPMTCDAFVVRLKAISRCCPLCDYKPASRSKKKIMLVTGNRATRVIEAWQKRRCRVVESLSRPAVLAGPIPGPGEGRS